MKSYSVTVEDVGGQFRGKRINLFLFAAHSMKKREDKRDIEQVGKDEEESTGSRRQRSHFGSGENDPGDGRLRGSHKSNRGVFPADGERSAGSDPLGCLVVRRRWSLDL